MDKIYKEFGFDLGHYFSDPSLMMDLILGIIDEKIGLITHVNEHFVGCSL